MLSDEDHAVGDQFGLPVSRKHPAARQYGDGFIQPGFFAYRGEREVFRFVQQPKLLNGFGAMRRPGPEELLESLR